MTGTTESYLGGFVGVNIGTIEQSAANGSVTGLGNRDVIGGFVGANFGSIDASAATGNATGATNSAVGAFAGANATFVNFPSESVSGSSFPVGTITNSIATGAANGGTGSTVDPFIALVDPTTAVNPPAFPSTIAGCTNPTCVFVATGVLPSSPISPVTPLTPPVLTPPLLPELLSTSPPSMPSAPPALLLLTPELLTSLAAQQAQVIQNLTGVVQLAALSTPPVVSNIQGAIKTPAQPPAGASSGAAAGGRQILPGLERRVVDIPPATETRLIQDEVVVQIAGNITSTGCKPPSPGSD